MRQLSLFLLFLLIATSGCQTAQEKLFTRVQGDMSKDTVLDIMGSPIRTELIDGKEKWAYKFYVNKNKDTILYKQITFINNKVVTFGDDLDEINRLNEIQKNDEKKASHRKTAEDYRKKNQSIPYESVTTTPGVGGTGAGVKGEQHKPTMEDIENERYYQDQTGSPSSSGASN